MSKLERQGKNCWEPPNSRSLAVFVDDLVRPRRSSRGITGIFELLRQVRIASQLRFCS